ncbi:hypothetical protein rosag_35250 [Roseisolibacter agri]|uniref:CHRD domain-containing protein n=1 Tax=Roseisolibacter agri TaxID=2014610 RepID=A0AA37V3P7_9BACT|nr:hypothetical protein rosag_35250 [Roseisolibacter agri]
MLSAVAAILLLPAAAAAQAVQFTANLTHDQEPPAISSIPPTTSTGAPRPLSFGTATFTLNAERTALTFTATIFNIDINGLQTPNDANDNLQAAHIHCCLALTNPPGAAGVRWGFFGMPDNDISPKQLVITPLPGGAVGGTFSSTWDLTEGNAGQTLATSLPNLLNNEAYINFHTTQFTGGEIRGQITQVVPEPSTYALMATGIAGVGLAALRRRRI